MAITFVGATTAVDGASSVSPTIHGSAITGDLMVCLIACNNNSLFGPTDPDVVTAGWAKAAAFTASSGSFGAGSGPRWAAIWYKVHDGSESSPSVISNGINGSLVAQILVFRGAGAWSVNISDLDWIETADTTTGTSINLSGTIDTASSSGANSPGVLVAATAVPSASLAISSMTATTSTAVESSFTTTVDIGSLGGNDVKLVGGYCLYTGGTSVDSATAQTTAPSGITGSTVAVTIWDTAIAKTGTGSIAVTAPTLSGTRSKGGRGSSTVSVGTVLFISAGRKNGQAQGSIAVTPGTITASGFKSFESPHGPGVIDATAAVTGSGARTSFSGNGVLDLTSNPPLFVSAGNKGGEGIGNLTVVEPSVVAGEGIVNEFYREGTVTMIFSLATISFVGYKNAVGTSLIILDSSISGSGASPARTFSVWNGTSEVSYEMSVYKGGMDENSTSIEMLL